MTLERGSVYPTRSSYVRDDRAMSVTIELSSSFRHDLRPHDRTLEAPPSPSSSTYPRATFRHPRGSAAKLEDLPSSDVPSRSRLRSQARGGTYPRATFRHARGSAAKLEGALTLERRSVTLEAPQPSSRGALTLEWRFRPFEARQARACGSSSKRRSAWSKCLVQARKLCPTPQTPTFNFTRFKVQFEFLEKIRIWKSELHGHATVPLARAALAGARPPRGRRAAQAALSWPSRGGRRRFHHFAAVASPRLAPRSAIIRSRAAVRTAGGRVHSPRAPSMATATATHALARSRGRTVPPLRAQSLHRALTPLLSLAHLAISTSPRSLGLLLPRAARTEPSFSEKFTLHTPPFPSSSRTKLALYSSSIFPHFPQAIVPSPARIRSFPPTSPCLVRRSLPGATPARSQGPFFIVYLCLGASVQKCRTEGAIPDGDYTLIPADEERAPEPGAGADVNNPEANSQSEQEGKPRSMT
nr:unnamed protein product [Digitaria exilis]